jgi:hypothetical protein
VREMIKTEEMREKAPAPMREKAPAPTREKVPVREKVPAR